MLQQFESIPTGVLSTKPENLHQFIPKPALFHLPGKNQQPLFISVMQHGNEPTGFLALQAILNKYHNKTLPRSLSLFFGNTLAAEQGLRHLEIQSDFNRIWPGTDLIATPESQIAAEIFDVMQHRKPFASIDIHNNTGINPHYACLNRIEPQFLHLASLFNRLIVHFTRPKGVQSQAFAELCPAVTLECGRPGQKHGVEHAVEFIDSCMHLSEIPDQALNHQTIDLYHTVAQVTISDATHYSFDDKQADLLLNHDLERMNFTEMPAGTIIAQVSGTKNFPVTAINEQGQDVTHNYFTIIDNQLQLSKNIMPSMLTLDEKVIQQDCLCYLMQRVNHE
jgi:succinylglutamate desuccinylase